MIDNQALEEIRQKAFIKLSAETREELAALQQFLDTLEAEQVARHEERLRELRFYARLSYVFVAFALIFLAIQIALRLTERTPQW